MRGIISIQSHVVYGHAGNSSAVFPLQRMGLEVWPINTVQFSNHTQYAEGWTGEVHTVDHLADLIIGLDKVHALRNCSAVISGYQGSTEQCHVVVDLVEGVRSRNPMAMYICDPVMGDPKKGCVVDKGIEEMLIHALMPLADVIVPNQYELSKFVDMEIHSLTDAIEACKVALTKGPSVVLVKHLHTLPESRDRFTMMLAYEDKFYITHAPKVLPYKPYVGVGDLITAVFTGGLMKGWSAVKAFKHCNEAVFGIVKETHASGEWELQTIAAQDKLITPQETFPLGECKKEDWEWHYYSV
ncbi:pyridoxal kinase PdxY [Vibrio sp. B172a]|uniref:pyridoxal kinase PdxY n=1 Tax=Vibrio sp. B172a TaxID=2835790 RepID=UPI00255611F7|nr:pyridoxal kinase PdxY [Vibrio sp. B172a]MDK9784620.1 pyridoxal kinase PdxY [Vibrio sp. B172a]